MGILNTIKQASKNPKKTIITGAILLVVFPSFWFMEYRTEKSMEISNEIWEHKYITMNKIDKYIMKQLEASKSDVLENVRRKVMRFNNEDTLNWYMNNAKKKYHITHPKMSVEKWQRWNKYDRRMEMLHLKDQITALITGKVYQKLRVILMANGFYKQPKEKIDEWIDKESEEIFLMITNDLRERWVDYYPTKNSYDPNLIKTFMVGPPYSPQDSKDMIEDIVYEAIRLEDKHEEFKKDKMEELPSIFDYVNLYKLLTK